MKTSEVSMTTYELRLPSYEKNRLIPRQKFGNGFLMLLVPKNLMIGPIILNTGVIRLNYCEKCFKTAEKVEKNRLIEPKYRANNFVKLFLHVASTLKLYDRSNNFE